MGEQADATRDREDFLRSFSPDDEESDAEYDRINRKALTDQRIEEKK